MSTLPGLPMFGHGQIEGYTEKYGMEYRWPRYQENADPWLMERHGRQIAPLLKQRALFAESSNFLLYDFYREDGSVDENVFAYSNRVGDQRALVLYHNRYASTRGTIHNSAAYADKGSGQLRQRRLREGLDLHADPAVILAYRDSMSGLEYLRRAVNLAEHGFSVELNAYECHVLLDWRELRATAEKPWDTLCDHLGGRGVRNLDDELVAMELRPTHDALRQLLEPALVRHVADLIIPPSGVEKQKAQEILREEFLETAWNRCRKFLREAQTFYRSHGEQAEAIRNPVEMKDRFRERARAALRIPAMESLFAEPWPAAARSVLPSYSPQLTATALWGPVLAWIGLEVLAESVDGKHSEHAALDLFDWLRLREPLGHSFEALGFANEEAWRVAARIKVALLIEAKVFTELAAQDEEDTAPGTAGTLAQLRAEAIGKPVIPVLSPTMWQDADVRWLTGAHEAGGHSYFIKESYEELLWWLQLPALCKLATAPAAGKAEAQAMGKAIAEAAEAGSRAGYSVESLLSAVPETPVNEREPESKDDSDASETKVDGEKIVKD
jgi:hypothetical protein